MTQQWWAINGIYVGVAGVICTVAINIFWLGRLTERVVRKFEEVTNSVTELAKRVGKHSRKIDNLEDAISDLAIVADERHGTGRPHPRIQRVIDLIDDMRTERDGFV